MYLRGRSGRRIPHLQQPVSFATIQQEKKAMGHSPTEAARNKLTLSEGAPGWI
jgi:hypothetical protein